ERRSTNEDESLSQLRSRSANDRSLDSWRGPSTPLRFARDDSSFLRRPIEHDFSRLPGLHELEAFMEVAIRKTVGNDRRNIETALDERGHLVPGFEHLPAVDALNRQAMEDHEVPVDRGAPRHDAQHRDPAAIHHYVEHF